MNSFLSVVIPIYKVEDYLERCIISVLNQDYDNFEVILVDDGSPDRCPQICDNYADIDNRVKVIHKKNGGLSSARNAGIESANGKYIVFLDSDDEWNNNCLSELMSIAQETNADLIMFLAAIPSIDGNYTLRKDNIFENEEYKKFSKLDLYKKLNDSGNLQESANTKLVKSDFLKQNNLFFKQGIIGEDSEWFFRVLRVVDEVVVSSVPLYHYYRNRPGSITNTVSPRCVSDVISTIKASLDYYRLNPKETTKYYELAQCAYLWSVSLGIFAKLACSDKEKLKSEMKDVVQYLDLSTHPKARRVGLLYSLLGLHLTSKILSFYIFLHKKNFNNRKKKLYGKKN